MKKSMKLFTVLAIVLFTTNTFASELGLKVANFNLYAPAAKSKKSSGGGKAFDGQGSKQLLLGVGLSSYIGSFGKGGFNSFV